MIDSLEFVIKKHFWRSRVIC